MKKVLKNFCRGKDWGGGVATTPRPEREGVEKYNLRERIKSGKQTWISVKAYNKIIISEKLCSMMCLKNCCC